MKNCTDCILDSTDACPRGAGRAADDSICSDFLEDTEVKFGKWIPVGERLPEETDEYIVSTIDTEDSDYHHVEIALFSRHRYQWERLPINTMVTAWMPLPEPYKAESEG